MALPAYEPPMTTTFLLIGSSANLHELIPIRECRENLVSVNGVSHVGSIIVPEWDSIGITVDFEQISSSWSSIPMYSCCYSERLCNGLHGDIIQSQP